MMKRSFQILALALLVTLGLAIFFESTPTARAIGKDDLQRGLRAAVKLGILGPDDEMIGTCSGTILDSAGFILTNFHCVGQTDIYGPDEEFGLSHGELYHPDGLLIVAINENTKKPPVASYIAQFVAGNPDQDVAVIKIVAYLDSNSDLPETLPIIPNILVDSDTVDIGDEVSILGFPGVGGNTVTFTDGKISGFQFDEDGDELADWFKTDALINGGNSGGSAVNANGEIIGIPSAKLSEGVDIIYFIKPVNQAFPIIERAYEVAGAGGEVTNITEGGETVPKGQNFGALIFGTGFGDNGVTGKNTTFKSGATEIHAGLPYANMKDNTAWAYMWQYEGQDALGEDGLKWEYGKEGLLDIWVTQEEGLPDGEYNLQVFLKGKLATEGGFVIGEADPEDKPSKPSQPEDEGVLVSGTIIDSSTKKPIRDAVIIFLVPGMTIDDFDNSEDMSTVLSIGITDAKGQFVIDVPLPRGEIFSVLVGKQGYERIAIDDAFETFEEDPSLIELEPIELDKAR